MGFDACRLFFYLLDIITLNYVMIYPKIISEVYWYSFQNTDDEEEYKLGAIQFQGVCSLFFMVLKNNQSSYICDVF